MRLYQREGSPYWWFDIREPGQPRKRVSTKQTTKGKAATYAKEYMRIEATGGVHSIGRSKCPRLSEFAVTFLEYIDGTRLRSDSKRYYHSGVRWLIAGGLGDVRMDSIRKSHSETFHLPGLSGSAVNCALRTLIRMLNYAKDEAGIIREVPKVKLMEEYGRERLINPQEEKLILARAHATIRDGFIFILDAGMRPKEVETLPKDHVDMARGLILIARQTKTGRKGRRFVHISSRMREILERRMTTPGPWVFPSRTDAEKHMGLSQLSQRFSVLKKRLKLPKEVVLYSARHTFATDYIDAVGGDVVRTSKALGHTNIQMTTRYVHSKAAEAGKLMDARNARRADEAGIFSVEKGHKAGHSDEKIA